MSYGFFTQPITRVFDGRSTASIELGNGKFIKITDTSNGVTADLCDATPETIPYFVCNVDETQPEEGIDTVDMTIKPGKFLRAKQPITGEQFCTSESESELAVGDTCYASSGVLKKSDGTETDVVQYYVVTEIDLIDDKKVYNCRVL